MCSTWEAEVGLAHRVASADNQSLLYSPGTHLAPKLRIGELSLFLDQVLIRKRLIALSNNSPSIVHSDVPIYIMVQNSNLDLLSTLW